MDKQWQAYTVLMGPIRDQDKLMMLDELPVMVNFFGNKIMKITIDGYEIDEQAFSEAQLKTWHEDARIEDAQWAEQDTW